MGRHFGKKGGQTAKVKWAERERQAVQRSGRGPKTEGRVLASNSNAQKGNQEGA